MVEFHRLTELQNGDVVRDGAVGGVPGVHDFTAEGYPLFPIFILIKHVMITHHNFIPKLHILLEIWTIYNFYVFKVPPHIFAMYAMRGRHYPSIGDKGPTAKRSRGPFVPKANYPWILAWFDIVTSDDFAVIVLFNCKFRG